MLFCLLCEGFRTRGRNFLLVLGQVRMETLIGAAFGNGLERWWFGEDSKASPDATRIPR